MGSYAVTAQNRFTGAFDEKQARLAKETSSKHRKAQEDMTAQQGAPVQQTVMPDGVIYEYVDFGQFMLPQKPETFQYHVDVWIMLSWLRQIFPRQVPRNVGLFLTR